MKIVCFGELMLRLAPYGKMKFLQEPNFNATFGGGEANVAVSLANYGEKAKFVTKLPKNDIADAAIRELKGLGVCVCGITRGGDRMGIYYVEKGAAMRPSKVIYDRAYSAISQATESDFNWDELLDGADWFHFTGITPALGKNVAAITEKALIEAKKKGLTVSCDLNYRKKLWAKEEARETMSKLMKYVDICIANEADADDVFGIKGETSDVEVGKLNRAEYESVAKQLTDKFGFKAVAITLRESISADDNNWGAMLYKDGKALYSKTYSIHIVDRVGGGDSFGAGLIYGLNHYENAQDALEFAVAASALKHTIEGDYNRVSLQDVESLMKGNASGRVQR